jgi:hypothetical protein
MRRRRFFMKPAGFPLHSRWMSEEYLRFLRQSAVLKASFHLTDAECVKLEV